MARSFEGDLNAEGLRFAVVASRFNDDIVSGLMKGALECLERHGAKDGALSLYRVPGAFEIPTLVATLAGVAPASAGGFSRRSPAEAGATFEAGSTFEAGRTFDAIIALGCLLRGDTPHFDFISAQVTNDLSRVAIDARLPVAFGVITCNTYEQAVERSSAGPKNKGWEAALAAIEMANLWRQIRSEGK